MNNDTAVEWQSLNNPERNKLIAEEIFGRKTFERNGKNMWSSGKTSWPVKNFLDDSNVMEIWHQIENNGYFLEVAYDYMEGSDKPLYTATIFNYDKQGNGQVLGAYYSKSITSALAVAAIMAGREKQ